MAGPTQAVPLACPQVLSMKKELNPVELDFLLRFPFKAGAVSPVDFLQHQGWGGIKVGLRPELCVEPSAQCCGCVGPSHQALREVGDQRRRGRAEGWPPVPRKLCIPVWV